MLYFKAKKSGFFIILFIIFHIFSVSADNQFQVEDFPLTINDFHNESDGWDVKIRSDIDPLKNDYYYTTGAVVYMNGMPLSFLSNISFIIFDGGASINLTSTDIHQEIFADEIVSDFHFSVMDEDNILYDTQLSFDIFYYEDLQTVIFNCYDASSLWLLIQANNPQKIFLLSNLYSVVFNTSDFLDFFRESFIGFSRASVQ